MDYEKKYKEALETARKINSGEGVPSPPGWTVCEVIFPELKESEDERIRKSIIEHLKYDVDDMSKSDCFDFEAEIEELSKYIAWLEKQGQTFTQKDVDDAYLKGVSDTKHELEKQEEKPQGKTALETRKDMHLEVYQQASGNRHEPNYKKPCDKFEHK